MTGFTTSVFLSRNRVSPKEAFEVLELCERKLSCTVLRGLDGSNPVRLLGQPQSPPWLITSVAEVCPFLSFAATCNERLLVKQPQNQRCGAGSGVKPDFVRSARSRSVRRQDGPEGA